MYKTTTCYFIVILCTVCLVSCGGENPQKKVEKYYTLIKQGDYQKAAEFTVDHFWKTAWLEKEQIENDREAVIGQEEDKLRENLAKDRLPKDFAVMDVTTDTDGTQVRVKEVYSDNDYECVYKFAKEDGNWIAVEKEFVSEAGKADAWYCIKNDDAKVALYAAPDLGADIAGYITNKMYIKGYPTRGAFMARKTDVDGWSAVIKDIWEFSEGNNGHGTYKGDVTYYVNRDELAANAKPER